MSRLRGFEALLAGCAKEAAIDLTADRLGEGLTRPYTRQAIKLGEKSALREQNANVIGILKSDL